jgi:hypothetical protein
MPDGFGNDAFQWKNSAHRTYSLGVGGSFSNTSDDTDRDVDTVRKEFEADMLEKLKDLVCDYYEHFDTMITVTNRETVREAACCYWDYAKDKLYGDLQSSFKGITEKSRKDLEQNLCTRVATLNSIGGTTRSCFAQTIITKTLQENNVDVAGLEGNLTLQAKQIEMQTWAQAYQAKYSSHIEGDNADFNKYMSAFQLLRGACFTENVDDNIDRDITTVKGTVQYNRSAGDISDTTGTYNGDIDDIIVAGGAALPNVGF